MYVWGYDFFQVVVALFGSFLCVDGPITTRVRFDWACVLIVISVPLTSFREISVCLDG